MSIIEKIYDISPIWVQNIMCSVRGYLNNRSRYGEKYWEYRKFFESFDKLSLQEQLEYQRVQLIKFIKFANQNSKFYNDLYKDIDIDSISEVEDLKKLPIVDKEMLRKNIDDVVTTSGGIENHTGGTTGKSLVVHSTLEDSMCRMALLDHFKARVGFEHRKMKRATFNGKHIVPIHQKKKVFWRYNAACKQMIYSSFSLTEENIGFYVESLNRFKPDAIDGFFTSMLDVADYIERHKLKLSFKPIAIFPTSETLTDVGREKLERVFGCKVYNQYASSEGAPFITECSNQKLHIELSSGVFEKLSDDSDEVLVTSFTTHGTPLIRYRIGDSVKFSDESACSCGLKGPIIDEIIGRKLDFLYSADGAKINAGNVSNILKNIPNTIIRAQFIQDRMDEVTMLVEVDKERYSEEHQSKLKNEFAHKFGENTELVIKVVDSIPRADSGKFRMIINNVV